jgi:hypothetical protein
MVSIRNIYTITYLMLVAALSACGGGSDSASQPVIPVAPVVTTAPSTPIPSVPIDYLKKYQGTWIQQCAEQIAFGSSPVVYGSASSRKKLVVSAPNADGKITIDAIEEFFDVTVACGDYASVPKVSLKESISTTGSFSRLVTLTYFGPTVFDAVNLSQPESTVLAIGSGASKIVVNGVPKWKIMFSDGKSFEQDAITPAFNGEIAFLLTSVNTVGNVIRIFGDASEYYKQ